MIGRIITCTEVTYDLPVLLAWKLIRTGSVPCDSFTVSFLYTPDMAEALHLASGFLAIEDGTVLLRGIVDEYTVTIGESGRMAVLSGRGYAARLLDNESRPLTYETATLQEIIRNHVTPYGIQCGSVSEVQATTEYKVSAGVSQWKALESFCRTYGGFVPWFSADGLLQAAPMSDATAFSIDEGTSLLELSLRENHYGVLSEALVIDKTRNASYSVLNQDWVDRGGQCRRVLYTPGQSTWAAMRYTGEYQIEQSKTDELVLTARLPGTKMVTPGSPVTLNRWGLSGTYRLAQAEYDFSTAGETTRLTMKQYT